MAGNMFCSPFFKNGSRGFVGRRLRPSWSYSGNRVSRKPHWKGRLLLLGSAPAQADDLRNVLEGNIHQLGTMKDFRVPYWILSNDPVSWRRIVLQEPISANLRLGVVWPLLLLSVICVGTLGLLHYRASELSG
ncbi:hypothetical protein CRG98_012381 [Punica granatum]|uniref:Uncharacterized protein n=1 Tax=Punica granatum TaxID=22663 RepID=A0A2I0KFZ3_PUNGR|nr:hypothetical protein CRG98_012381 [Punica granatum]